MIVALLFVISPVAIHAVGAEPTGSAPQATTATTDTTVPAESVTDSTAVWRLENDPSECINSNPRPNCGYKPTDAGERGGALQVSLFFIMMGAIAVIGTVIIRNIIKRDRAIAAELARRESATDH
jgi:hypothetical protein